MTVGSRADRIILSFPGVRSAAAVACGYGLRQLRNDQ